MKLKEVQEYFTRRNGDYVFARWGKPIAPVAFGAKPEALEHITNAYTALSNLTGRPLAEENPETGPNCVYYFCGAWDELRKVAGLKKMVSDLDTLLDRLEEADSNQYRLFQFDDENGIKGVVVMLRMKKSDGKAGDGGPSLPAETMLLGQAVQSILLWREGVFNEKSAFERKDDQAVLRPEIGDLIRACYAEDVPNMSRDAASAGMIKENMSQLQ